MGSEHLRKLLIIMGLYGRVGRLFFSRISRGGFSPFGFARFARPARCGEVCAAPERASCFYMVRDPLDRSPRRWSDVRVAVGLSVGQSEDCFGHRVAGEASRGGRPACRVPASSIHGVIYLSIGTHPRKAPDRKSIANAVVAGLRRLRPGSWRSAPQSAKSHQC